MSLFVVVVRRTRDGAEFLHGSSIEGFTDRSAAQRQADSEQQVLGEGHECYVGQVVPVERSADEPHRSAATGPGAGTDPRRPPQGVPQRRGGGAHPTRSSGLGPPPDLAGHRRRRTGSPSERAALGSRRRGEGDVSWVPDLDGETALHVAPPPQLNTPSRAGRCRSYRRRPTSHNAHPRIAIRPTITAKMTESMDVNRRSAPFVESGG